MEQQTYYRIKDVHTQDGVTAYPFAPKSLGQAICREATFRQRRRVCPGMKGADREAVISAAAGPQPTV